MDQQTLIYYAKNASAVAERYESISNGLARYFEQSFPAASRVLDVGCGSGRDMAQLKALGRDAYGLDATAELVHIAQTLHPELHSRIVQGAIPGAPVPFGGCFDGVLCSALLMHIAVSSQMAAAKFIRDCLRPGGTLLYSVPSKRLDAATGTQRDAAGRLFIPDTAGRLQKAFVDLGFIVVDQWSDADSLGRDEVEWASILMRLSGR